MTIRKIHDFRGEVDGVKRWAEVMQSPEGFSVNFFKDQVWYGSRQLYHHSEQYAEDCAENFVLGVFDVEGK